MPDAWTRRWAASGAGRLGGPGPDGPVPGYLGRVLNSAGTPAGTCFQVAPGVLVTASLRQTPAATRKARRTASIRLRSAIRSLSVVTSSILDLID